MVLCDEDPKVAKNALGEFAMYLRGNMDSLSSDKPIPFKNELDHVKKYVYLETLRFGERLNVEFNITETEFNLPALSLQPIVENAVKYGIGAKMEGGTIKISTYIEDDKYYIVVEDNGVGMNVDRIEDIPSKDDGRSHIGLQNVKKRIKEMSNGNLYISSKLGEGTTVTIMIPAVKEGQ
jgi:sensor histidine kinase YesM